MFGLEALAATLINLVGVYRALNQNCPCFISRSARILVALELVACLDIDKM
jgi:hypothetical protein